ncbi:hypothetical protein [Amycolatopsis panacis]|uniref:DsrE family protein n=1 Tax=Amycolatopsis panacis TaxID=2340917 RepID=A0A419HJB1_9PSEU|nr:hypothetical protein [Amycolatopsis panacis]RJQ75854.1 hypothetical protein D5S19_30995 [Amycolatopsis panacis]
MTPDRAYLLVETRADATANRFLADAEALARAGERVRLFLVADAVALGIRGAHPVLPQVVDAGGQVWIDAFTLAHRALRTAPLADGVTPAGMDDVAEALLTAGVKVVWH